MNILNDIVRGASSQFGREFGRAGANVVLKGANSYTVNGVSDYTGRIKPSDSDTVKAVKEIQKIKFVTTNKANISRLIDLTNIILKVVVFNGISTLNELTDIKEAINSYNDKFEHGSALIEDSFQDKSVDFLETKRKELLDELNEFNSSANNFIDVHYQKAYEVRKLKKIATLLSIPFWGQFGLHRFYLNQVGTGIVYLLFSITFIPFIISLVECFSFISMTEDKFDAKFNPSFSYFKRFK